MNNYIELNGHRCWYLEDDIQRPYRYDFEWINDQYCIKGKLCHREDGPAIEYSDRSGSYFQYESIIELADLQLNGLMVI